MYAKLSGICKIIIKIIPLTLQAHRKKPKSGGTESDEEDVNENDCNGGVGTIQG